jgi:hypothetical protein
MVNKHGLIFIPLIFMFTIAMFSLVGLEDSDQLGEGYKYGNLPEPYLYDWTGRPIINTTSFLSVVGWIAVQPMAHDWGTGQGIQNYELFTNTSGLWVTGYYLYTTSAGNSTGLLPILHDDFYNYKNNAIQNNFLDLTADFNTSYGLIALFISLMVGIGLAGIHFLGIGESETGLQTIFMGAGLIAVWAVFSVVALNLLAQIPLGLGAIFYFGLTLSYVVGLILNIGK